MADPMRGGVLRWHGRRAWRVAAVVALVAVVLVTGTVVVMRERASALPVTSESAGGLTYTLSLTPGPYFLRELTIAQLTLTNHSHTTYQIAGSGDCGQPLSLSLTGSGGPTYTLPLPDTPYSCPLLGPGPLAPGATLHATVYLPLTVSGEATLTARVGFATITSCNSGGTCINTIKGPFAGHLPSLHLSIASTTPPDRLLTLKETMRGETPEIMASGPSEALGSIYTLGDVSCGDRINGPYTMEGPIGWNRLRGTALGEPGCPGPNEVWAFAVAAPGYAIATGSVPQGARL